MTNLSIYKDIIVRDRNVPRSKRPPVETSVDEQSADETSAVETSAYPVTGVKPYTTLNT